MRYLAITLFFLIDGMMLFGQDKGYVHAGNEHYKQKQYKEAEADYRRSVDEKKQNIAGNFNLGDALYKQKKFTYAADQFNGMTAADDGDKSVKSAAYYNMGNSLLENKKLEESIEAYKKSLLNNPKDDEARYNLAYAQQKLKQQQQNKDNKNQQNKDNKNQQNKDNQKQDNKKQDNKNNQDKEDKKQGDKNKQNQPQPDKLSKEDAERMLDALNDNEKQTQDKLKNKKMKGEKMNIAKDW